jgi:pantoate--beta-alanine ligase
MILFKKATDLRNYLDAQVSKGKKIGFVPTMGALHAGHISLAKACKQANDLTVSSLFVNPTQFNDKKDFEKYPVTIEQDIRLLESAGCDVLFLPSVTEMYPDGVKQLRHYELGDLETRLEGKYRPGHFQGVCMVVHRLLDIVRPHNLYLGQKDYQQCMVIAKLLDLTGMSDYISITICPTLREPNGLAMSSRNMRLSEEEKVRASTIYRALCLIKDQVVNGDIISLKEKASLLLADNQFRVDYVEIADARTLEPITIWDGKQKGVALVAAFLGEVRLIDNLLIS